MYCLFSQPPLLQAIFHGNVEAVRTLLSQKEDTNWQDKEQRSLLHAAAYRSISRLIKCWKLNKRRFDYIVQLKCLVFSHFRGDTAIVELLLLNGAATNSKDKKWLTPLHRACCSGNYNVVDILLRYKADVNARDRSWQTPLHVAAANNAVQCVELLMPHLLNINVTDRFVHTLVMI